MNPASTASLRLLEFQKIAFEPAGVLAGNLKKTNIFSFYTVKRKSCLGVLEKPPTLGFRQFLN